MVKQLLLATCFCFILSSCGFKDDNAINGLLHITGHDIKVKIGQIGEQDGKSIFKCRISNISHKTLYIGDLTMQELSNYYEFQGHRSVTCSIDMGANNLRALEPGHSIDKVFTANAKIPSDLTIRLSFLVPEQIDPNKPYIYVTKTKAILFFDLAP